MSASVRQWRERLLPDIAPSDSGVVHGAVPAGSTGSTARRLLVLPSLMALIAVTGLSWLSFGFRPLLVVVVLAGGILVAAEFLIPWQRLPVSAYLPLPLSALAVLAAGMSASGGWSSPLRCFLVLPPAYAVAAMGARRSVPVGVGAALVAASPGLYTRGGSPLLVLVGALAAYAALVGFIQLVVHRAQSSDQIAVLEAEARRQSEARAQDLLTLQHVSAIVADHLGLDEAIAAIVREASATLGHSLVSLYLREGDELVMKAQVGYTSYYQRIGWEEGVIGMAASRGEVIFVRNVRADPLYREAEGGVASELAIPLRDGRRAIGVLNVESYRPLTDRDHDLMVLFAAQVSVVLRNARLAEELRKRAEQDSLTGLSNHRSLMEALERRLAAGPHCAVLLIDVNDLKAINDRHGHLTGDRLLRHVAGLLRETCRQEDVCARTGGDEFIIVLPGSGAEAARQLAGRIQQVASDRPLLADGLGKIDVSLSIGVAAAPGDGTTREALLEQADQRMYGVKRPDRRRMRSA